VGKKKRRKKKRKKEKKFQFLQNPQKAISPHCNINLGPTPDPSSDEHLLITARS